MYVGIIRVLFIELVTYTVERCLTAKAGGDGEGGLGVHCAVYDDVPRHGAHGRHHPAPTLASQIGRRRRLGRVFDVFVHL